MLNLVFQQFKRLAKEVHMVREPHGLLEEVNWSAEKSKYNLRSILKSCFLGQIELSFFIK